MWPRLQEACSLEDSLNINQGDTQFSATKIIVGDGRPINPQLSRHQRLKYV